MTAFRSSATGVVVIPALIRVPDGIASGEAAAGVRPEAVSRRVVPCLAPRVQRHSPLDDLFQTDSMPRLSASPLLWHAEAMTTKRSKRSIYLTDKLANSQYRMQIWMAGQPRGRSSVETQTRQNTHSELGVLVRRLACTVFGGGICEM